MLPFASAAVAGGACDSASVRSSTERAPGGRVTPASSVDASEPEAGPVDGGDAGCAHGSLPLLIDPQSDAPGAAPYKLYVPARTDGQSAVFLLDTGSPYTFLHEPLVDGGSTGVVPDAGSAIVACDQLDLFGAAVSQDPPIDGLRVAGTLGDEHLLARPLHLDLSARRILWNDPGVPFAGTSTWPSARIDRPGGYVRIHDVAFDGTPVQMFVDTGSADSLWLGQQGQPGDREIVGVDARGDRFNMYLGTVTLSIGAYQEKVPVLRVPSFPYLQEAVDALHGQLNGLFGLSSFVRGIVFDTDTQVVRIAP
ncbi:MAG TPA: hypothetical protein VF765_15185 [Polyangiaceae bacterium]